MICYRDMSFCTHYKECLFGKNCAHALTPSVKVEAVHWWGGEDAPIAVYAYAPACFARAVTEDDFRKAVGRGPQHDDMDRCNCELQGGPGHSQCGWCELHEAPRLWCGCLQHKKTPE